VTCRHGHHPPWGHARCPSLRRVSPRVPIRDKATKDGGRGERGYPPTLLGVTPRLAHIPRTLDRGEDA
jgi:hypothetical protein